MAFGATIMIVGAVIQASAFSRAHLITGRVISGVGMGCINSTGPVLQAEFSPKMTRGLCRCSTVLGKCMRADCYGLR
jgi:MFS family permease